MLVDDAFENGRIAASIPSTFRIDDRDRTAFADAQAVCLRPKDAAGFGQAQLLEALLQKFPCFDRSLAIAAFRVRLIGAQKDMPPRTRHADRRGNILQS